MHHLNLLLQYRQAPVHPSLFSFLIYQHTIIAPYYTTETPLLQQPQMHFVQWNTFSSPQKLHI